jgi:hypothetical protein
MGETYSDHGGVGTSPTFPTTTPVAEAGIKPRETRLHDSPDVIPHLAVVPKSSYTLSDQELWHIQTTYHYVWTSRTHLIPSPDR